MFTPVRLFCRTRRIPDPGDLLPFAAPAGSTQARDLAVMLRRGDGIVGRGVAWRGEFRGAHRIRQAKDAWQQLIAEASCVDEVRIPGSGLVAFGAFAFANDSAATSVLQVPRFIFGRRGSVAFLSEISSEPFEQEDAPITASIPAVSEVGSFPPVRLDEGTMTRVHHQRAVFEALKRIRRGEFAKVVLARDVRGQFSAGHDLRGVLARLAANYPETWVFGIDGLIGASPEMLVRVVDAQVTARVLAGTAARLSDPAADARAGEQLRASAKNLREHRYAVQSVLCLLGALDRHDEPEEALTASPEPFLLGLPNVWHLASDIHGTLPASATVLDLVDALHPTAAVGGTPRVEALAAISELEPFDRRRYAGPAGWVSAAGDGEWVVALRSAEFDCAQTGGTVTAYAGGGIVASSNPAEEFTETALKLQPIADALGAGETSAAGLSNRGLDIR